MKRAPHFSARLLFGFGLAIAALGAIVAVAGADDVPAVQTATVANFTGTWRGSGVVNGQLVNFIWKCDGPTFSTFVEGQAAPFASGKFEVANGRWKTMPAGLPEDEGPFQFINNADTVVMTGKAGSVVWMRVKAGSGAGAAANPAPAAPQAIDPSLLTDFAAMRRQAKSAAAAWNPAGQLLRVDLWGAFAKSRFAPTGARFIFFAANAGKSRLEVRFENGSMSSAPLALDLAGTPAALPDTVLGPEDALWRLWDLAPTVHANQIYLQLLRTGVEASAEPDSGFMDSFPVPLRDKPPATDKQRTVWRMLAIRDFDARQDQAYGAFIYADAVSGGLLSKCMPAVGTQVFQHLKLYSQAPIGPFVFPSGEIALDSPAEKVGTFDRLPVAQKAQSMDMGLRAMVRDRRPAAEIRGAIDKVDAWADQIAQVRREDAQHGIAVLEQAARDNPNDIAAQAALFRRYVNEIDKDKMRALASPVVTKIQGLNKDSEFWFANQFEVADNCLGTHDQTHMVLDTHTGEWLFKMQDPPHTLVYSKYFQPALTTLAAARATGKNDYELDKQVTRLNWLIGGNGPAIGNEDSLNPIDPLQLMCYAEFNRVRGSEKMLNAERLRLPKTWSTSSRRDLGDGGVEVTSVTYTRPPTADELAAADRLDWVAKNRDAVTVTAVQDLSLKLQPAAARIYYLWGRVEAVFYDAQLADRIAVSGLFRDPGSADLHAVRVIAWKDDDNVNKAEVYCATKFAGPYTLADLQAGSKLAQLDPVAGYFITLQRLRLAPDDAGSHAVMCDVLSHLDGTIINKEEFMPDAQEQRELELGVGAAMIERLVDHPDEWHKGVPKGMPATRENLVKNEVGLLVLRGQTLATLDRPDEARECFQKALALDPDNEAARQGLQ